ncbi:MAG: hypothetical protein HQK59_15380 [Deltaproteobacteria bacterium]|nr:hypothetical protein [Deltaproteobacteria bacterium]
MEPACEEFIKVPFEVAQAFNAANEAEREKALFRMKLSLAGTYKGKRDLETLFKIMDEISDEAESKGLTPEILNEILNEK